MYSACAYVTWLLIIHLFLLLVLIFLEFVCNLSLQKLRFIFTTDSFMAWYTDGLITLTQMVGQYCMVRNQNVDGLPILPGTQLFTVQVVYPYCLVFRYSTDS